MRKLGRWWDWLLPGLICLCPMGALAYYNPSPENEVHFESKRVGRRARGSESHRQTAVIPFARL